MSDIRTTLAERGKRYGEFKTHAKISQDLQSVMHDHINATELEPFHIEAIAMICHKLARIANGDPNYDDSWRDIAGYAQLVVDILTAKQEPKP